MPIANSIFLAAEHVREFARTQGTDDGADQRDRHRKPRPLLERWKTSFSASLIWWTRIRWRT